MKEKDTCYKIESNSSKQTFDIGFAVGMKSGVGDVFALSGELGAGKTCFTAGLARGLGVSEDYTIASPTFIFINEYPGRCRLYHFDVYRLNQISELDDLGYEEYVSGKGVVAIEWAEKIADVLPPDTVVIRYDYVDEDTRIIGFSGPQEKIRGLVRDMKREV